MKQVQPLEAEFRASSITDASRHSSAILLFGATGDLARRMLLPSLAGLHADGLLAPNFKIVATARSEGDDVTYREFARTALTDFMPAGRIEAAEIDRFLTRLSYQPLDVSDSSGFAALAAKLGPHDGDLAIFLSTAPALFQPTIEGLAAAGLAGERVRIALEKPLGTNLASIRLREVPLDISIPNILGGPKKRIAYERLLLDLITGNQTLFVRRDEVEAQWAWIDAIRRRWTDEISAPRIYTAGSWGPSAAIALAERDGVTWHD